MVPFYYMLSDDFFYWCLAVKTLQIEKGLGLPDVLKAMFDRLQLSQTVTASQRIFLLKQLADIE